MMFIPVAIRKINTLMSYPDFVRVIGIGHDVVELDFSDKIATVGFMGNVFWSDKE